MKNSPELEKANKLVREAEQKNIDDCSAALEKLLSKYNCILVPQMVFRGSQIMPQVLILPKPVTEDQLPKLDSKPAARKILPEDDPLQDDE